ncbi:MAG: response regulator [bacterium]|nr:response regulator [bacterium]
MAPDGGLKYILDKTSGLQDDNIKYVFQDKSENLWLCLNNGISKIEYASPLSIHDERSKLSGLTLSIVKHNNNLYAGTSKGLYRLESPFKFRPVPNIPGNCWNLLSIDGSVLAATSRGVYVYNAKNDSRGRQIIPGPSYALLYSKHYPDLVWCGTSYGLIALTQNNGRWQEKHRYEDIKKNIRSIVADQNGILWLGTLSEGILKVDFPVNITQPVVISFETSHGPPGGGVEVAWAAGHVLFSTSQGLYRFEEKKQEFVPDETLGSNFAGGENSNPVFRLIEGKNKTIWFHSAGRNYQAIPEPGGSFKIYSKPFLRLPTMQTNAIYPDPDGKVAWFTSFDGLIRYDTEIKKDYQQDFQTLVRRVIVSGKQIFDGFKNKSDKTSKNLVSFIKYKDRKYFQFEFAAPFFETETQTHYKCFLEGYDDNWTNWDTNAKSNYMNLDSGLYKLRVQAKNIYQHIGKEDVFIFRILPPWHRTWWAFLLYAIGIILAVVFIVKWRSRKLEQDKQKLEITVAERTREIHEKNRQLLDQTLKLKEQSQKLEEMAEIKSRFFANISHEFRTPLTLIMSPLERLFSDGVEEKHKKELDTISRSTQRLLTLIDQLLDLSRLDSGKIKLNYANQNIVSFLKGAVSSFHTLSDQKRLKLNFRSKEEYIFLNFDTQKMEEVMYNLLINAVKFTPGGGNVSVSVSLEKQNPTGQPGGFVKISVKDTGISIPPDQLPHIFDRFYQVERPGGEDYKGTGIGLALTREIVLLHQGKIDVHSQEGKGTEFEVRLPMEPGDSGTGATQPAPETVPGRNLTKKVEAHYNAIEGDNEEPKTKPDAPHEKGTGKQEKNVILVVEDHAEVRDYIRSPLEKSGYKVETAGDGEEGIAKAKEIIPDLIVSDIMMPKVSGEELCRELKKDIATSHIPIILLTAKASDDSVVNGLETGADDYITKPFKTHLLLARIKNLIDQRRQLQLKLRQQDIVLPPDIRVSSLDEKFLNDFQDIIKKNYKDPDFNVDQLSEKLYMSRSTLFRKVQAVTGETPNQRILSYRLERAAQLLKKDFGNITEVAFAVGFQSPAYFSKCFKDKFHQSPKTFHTPASKSS